MSAVGDLIGSARVVVCCGPGGVGKTTTAAALGLAAARSGRRVVVITVDPARRLGEALGLVDGLGPDPTRVDIDAGDSGGSAGGELWAMMLDPEVELERVVRSHAVRPGQADEALSNPFTRSIGTSLGGTQEYMATEAVYRLGTDERFDLVVVDTPPSDRALEVIEAPDVLVRFLDHQVFKLLMGTGGRVTRLLSAATQPLLKAVGRVIGTGVLDDVVRFLRSFTGMEHSFRERAVAVRRLWRDPSTAFVLVTAPRPDTVAESRRFAGQLGSAGIGVDLVIANRCSPAVDGVDVASARRRAVEADGDTRRVWEYVAWCAEVHAAESVVLEGDGPTVEGAPLVRVDRLATDVHDLSTLASVAAALTS
jgi:anion-transporting  ArsA/GET3 family ATPase